jgi:integrase
MAKINFYLKNAKPAGDSFWKTQRPALVYLFFSYSGKRTKISTGLSIAPALWSRGGKKVKGSATNSAEINDHLEGFGEQFEKVYHDLAKDGYIPQPDELKAAFIEFREAPEKKEIPLLVPAYLEYISEVEGVRSSNSIKNYKMTVTHLERYEAKKLKGKKLTFSDMDHKFYFSFLHHLNHTEKLSDNSAGNIIKLLKSYLRHASKIGLHENMAFEDYKVLKVEVLSTYLNREELRILKELDLRNTPGLERARDLFLIACWTSLRFSDCSKLNREDIQDGIIRIRTEKTGELVAISVTATVQSILDKYEGGVPQEISNQKMNQHLKKIAKKAGFDTIVTRSKVTAGQKEVEMVPRYELITSHTARRSFATNFYKAGFPIGKLMLITGHRTESAFRKYIKVHRDEAAEDMRDLMRKWEGEESILKVV